MNPEHASTSPEAIEQIKAAIFDQWQRLPLEAQVAVLTDQLRVIMDSEAGTALREALRTEEAEPDALHTIFPITGFSRADLQKRLHFRKRDLEQLEDHEMREIAGRLEDHYVEMGFWDDLDYVTRYVLERKRKLATRK